MDFGRNTAAREPTGLRTLGLSQMRNRQRHTFYGWVRLSFIPCQRPWGHPRSVGGRQDRFVVARIAGRPLANCERASLFAAQ